MQKMHWLEEAEEAVNPIHRGLPSDIKTAAMAEANIPEEVRLQKQVDHPDYYNTLSKETIESIKEGMTDPEFRGYLKGNILKYILRYPYKGMPLKDLMKAEWYLKRLIEELKGDE